MANLKATAGARDASAEPIVRRIGTADLRDALAKGLDDFKAMPTHAVFVGLMYPVIGLILSRFAFGYEILPLLFPLMSGFALIGPFAAIGLCELSRRREAGLDTSWNHAFEVFRSHSIGSIAAVGLILAVIFVFWLLTAQALYGWLFGPVPITSMPNFLQDVLTTSRGWTLIVVGNALGFLFAVLSLAVSAVSFPLLLDRDVGAATAVRTSIKAVQANPQTMAIWGLIVAGALVVGSLPLFVGLAVVVPVLGHSTWHLYRKVVQS